MVKDPNITPNELMFALRLTEISRWGLVAMGRQQSVGEHSFRVCMIAVAMYDFMEDGQSHNSFERIQISSFSVVHDILEILSGDVDAIFKLAMNALCPGAIKDTVWALARQRPDVSNLHTKVLAQERAAKGTIVEAIVKLADMIEALIYLDMYGTNQRHKQMVRDNILERMWQKLEEYKKVQSFGLTPEKWTRIEQFINLVLNQPGLDEKARRAIDEQLA